MSRNHAMRLGKRQAEDMQPWLDAWPDKASCHATPSGFIFNDAHIEAIGASFTAWYDGLNKVAQKRLIGVLCDLTRMASDAQRQRERKEKAETEAASRLAALALADEQLLAFLTPLNAKLPLLWRCRTVLYKPPSKRSAGEFVLELEYTFPNSNEPIIAYITSVASCDGLRWRLVFTHWTYYLKTENPVLCDSLADALARVATYEVPE